MKIKLANIIENALGGIVTILVTAVVGQIYNVLTGKATASIWLWIVVGATVLIIVMYYFKDLLARIGQWVIANWQLVVAIILTTGVMYGVFELTQSVWLILLAVGYVIAQSLATIWLCKAIQIDGSPKSKILFHDVFDSFDGWNDFKNGQVTHTSEQAHIGSHSLKKSGANDPHGGFKEIGQEIGRGFVFSGWVYSPVGRSGEADRLAIEDHHFNGYGFAVDRKAHTVFIEQRHEGNRNEDKPLSPPKQLGTSFLECWYHFELVVEAKRLRLRLYDPDSGTQISTPWVRDNQFSSFDRVVVHGGRPYYVDDLKIEKH
jgi:hypothetical protein